MGSPYGYRHMRSSRPSFTARQVALIRAGLERPHLPTGDDEAETRLYQSLSRRHRWIVAGKASRQGVVYRTAFFDREVLLALAAGVRQVGIIGAGYDGRSLRFAFPGVRYFEIDHPATQQDKVARLARIGADSGAITFVPIDLITGDLVIALGEAGLERSPPALFLVEGLLSYLPRTAVETLFGSLREVAGAGARLAAGFLMAAARQPAHRRAWGKLYNLGLLTLGEPWMTVFDPGEPERLLADTGWQIAEESGSPVSYQGPRALMVRAAPTGPITP